jgi:hypothetical protein
MMTTEGRGILNDWDFAKRVPKPGEVEVPRDHQRTVSFFMRKVIAIHIYAVRQGTWQFISTMNLRYPGKQHVVQDDIESFIWVVFYHVLRYTRHSITLANEVQDTMIRIFDDYSYHDGDYKGGHGKTLVCTAAGREAALGEDFTVTRNPALTSFITSALDALEEWHVFVKPPVTGEDTSEEDCEKKSSIQESDLFFFDQFERPQIDTTHDHPQTDNTSDSPRNSTKDIENVQLKDHQNIAKFWIQALGKKWPNNDEAEDNLPEDTDRATTSKRPHDDDGATDVGAQKQKKSKSMGSRGIPMTTRRSSTRR